MSFDWLEFMDEKIQRNVEVYGNPKQTLWPWLGGHIVTQRGSVVPVAVAKPFVPYKAPTLGNEAFECEALHCEVIE